MSGQLDIFNNGYVLAQKGIKQALDNANDKADNWASKAYKLLEIYLKTHMLPFLCEDFRKWTKDRIEEPPSKRAYGGIIQKASRNKLIKKLGYKQVTNPKAHCANAGLWIKN